ncbi:cell division protein FtsZ [Candidatus Endowatersipora endosymbiont of Watersipora subatra]|uniref:cell division protein FtsZ n=1 Tax=Candidatus Endowatersipora endosymbiont of Watersipora subatra TaxID=3077946 RepID=UPI00312CB0F7
MTINLQKTDITELKPRITVFGVGGGGGNAVNNMIHSGLEGVEFVVANTDAQALAMSKAERLVQMGVAVTEGLGAGSQPEIGCAAAEECIDEINDHLSGTHMAFVTAGMGGGTGTGAAPVVARAAREMGILTVGVITKPFSFEGKRRMMTAEAGIDELQKHVDTLIVIPNQNLFRIANEKTTFADAFSMADEVLYSGVACITDLMVKEGLINLDFADVRSVMREMGRAMMGTGEASSEGRAMAAAEAAISNPLLDETSMVGAHGVLISITGGRDMTLFEVDEAATRIREEVDPDANIILGATFDESLEGVIRVSVVATGIDGHSSQTTSQNQERIDEGVERLQQSAMAYPTGSPVILESKADEKDEKIESEPTFLETTLPVSSALLRGNEREHEPMITDRGRLSEIDFQKALKSDMTFSKVSGTEMPKISDVPPSVGDVREKELVSKQGHANDENGPIGLLKRFAKGFGATRSTKTSDRVDNHQSINRSFERDPHIPCENNNPSATQRNNSLDMHDRMSSSGQILSEDDELDIPAFLRREAN